MGDLRKRLWISAHWMLSFFLAAGWAFLLSPDSEAQADCITPLDIVSPVYVGTKVIAYEHGTSGCPVYIYAKDNSGHLDLVGRTAVAPLGWGSANLSRVLKEGEVIIGKQDDTKGYPTWPENSPVVTKIPYSDLIMGEQFKTPSIVPPFFDCQKGFNVGGLTYGVRADYEITGVAPAAGSVWTPYDHTFLGVPDVLKKDDTIASWQDMDKAFPKQSDRTKATVQELPKDLGSPIIPQLLDGYVPAVLWGSSLLKVCDQWVGASVDIYKIDPSLDRLDRELYKERVGGGIATGSCNVGVLKEPLQKNTVYFARQSLCGVHKDSNSVVPTDWISQPFVCTPCEADTHVVVNRTDIGSTVQVRVRNQAQGTENFSSASSTGTITIVPLSGGVPLRLGDMVAARQSNSYQDSGDWILTETNVIKKEACDYWKRLEPGRPWPNCEASKETGTPPDAFCEKMPCQPTTASSCPDEGNSCMIRPPECSDRAIYGQKWMISGKIVCQNGKSVCVAKPFKDYCPLPDGAGCGDAPGAKCDPNASKCAPTETCQLADPIHYPGRFACVPIGLGCTPIPNFCWTKDEVGIPQVGCQEWHP